MGNPGKQTEEEEEVVLAENGDQHETDKQVEFY